MVKAPSWGDILKEIKIGLATDGPHSLDNIRRKYLARMSEVSGRNTILYSSRWTVPTEGLNPGLTMVNNEDIHGFMEAIHDLDYSKGLDLVIHSPGGSPTAAEALVKYIRAKFSDVRVVVPQAAMSAATMIACSSDRVIMGKHSVLGPVDPQFTIMTPLGVKMVPAVAVLDQFKRAQEECKDPQKLTSWLPMLSQYGPSFLIECTNAITLSKVLVSQWLTNYMFKGEQDATEKGMAIAEKLSDHNAMLSHGRPLDCATVRSYGLKVDELESDQDFQDAVLSTFHATMHTFNFSPVVKIIENNLGKAYVKTMPINQGIHDRQQKNVDIVTE
ncbi:MAG: serine protease [Methanomassiliicoccus sp.]|nr:serine protease [Methanomassiliicoccus sp.]